MISESARSNSAAEAQFRVKASDSRPRTIVVIALDGAGEAVVRRVAHAGWTHATFFSAASRGETDHRPADSPDGEVRDLAGHLHHVSGEVDAADLVVLVAGPGGHAYTASAIGQACSVRRVMTTGFVVGVASASGSDVSKTLAQLRPWSLMVVIANTDESIDDLLTALRAS